MTGKDVFGVGDDGERTVIRRAVPRDDDRTQIQVRRPMLEPGPAVPVLPVAVRREDLVPCGRFPLAAAAARLLVIAAGLLDIRPSTDLKALRQSVEQELDAFRHSARQLDVDDKSIATGHYALCATLDDLVLSSPVGGESFWRKPSLVATYHNEVVSGDRMFDIAEELIGEANPARLPLLELIFLCFSLGFEGRLRIDPRGHSGHVKIRDRLYHCLRSLAGTAHPELSPQWRGAGKAHQPLSKTIPWWVWWASCGLAALLIYAGLLFSQSLRLDGPLGRLAAMQSKPKTPYPRSDAITPSDETSQVRGLLDADIASGRLSVIDRGDAIIIRLASSGLFASGSADINPDILPTLDRVAKATALIKGRIEIQGHTDSVPIRSLRFPSNMELSQARAQGVATTMRGFAAGGGNIGVKGFGADDPVADNSKESGRAQNRRVDVLVYKTPGWQRLLAATGARPEAAPVLPDIGGQP